MNGSGSNEQVSSKSFFKNTFLNVDTNFKFLFISVLLLQIWLLSRDVIFILTKDPVSLFFETILKIISAVGFLVFSVIYMSRKSDDGPLKLSSSGFFAAASSFVLFLCYYTILSALPYHIPRLIPQNFIYYIWIFIVQCISFSAIMLFTSVLKYRSKVYRSGISYLHILVLMIKKIHIVIIYNLVIAILLIIASYITGISNNILNYLVPYGFLKNIILIIITGIIYAYILSVTLDLCLKLLESLKPETTEVIPKKGLRPSLLFSVIPLCLLVVFLMIQDTTEKDYVFENYMSEIHQTMQKGVEYQVTDLPFRSINEYDRAYSMWYSIKGYLEGIQAMQNSESDALEEADKHLSTAKNIDPENDFSYIFRGHLLMAQKTKDPDIAIEEYTDALRYSVWPYPAYIGLVQAYTAKKEVSMSKNIVNLLIGHNVYEDPYLKLIGMSKTKISRYLFELEEYLPQFAPALAFKAIEKIKVNDYQGAVDDLLALKEQFPLDPTINLYLARIANEYSKEHYNYKLAIESAQQYTSLLNTKENEYLDIRKNIFKAQIAFSANDTNLAESILEELHFLYPEDTETIKQYTFVLIRNGNFSKAKELIKIITETEPENGLDDYLYSVIYLNSKDYQSSLDKMQMFISKVDGVYKYNMSYDQFLYSYCLMITQDPDIELYNTAVQKLQEDSLLFNYLSGIDQWRSHNNTEAKKYFFNIININENLGYAHYMLGVNCFEEEYISDNREYEEAEEHLINSLKLLPYHVEGYFTIGQCYKKWGKNVEALRAFRKLLDLLPFQDHASDPYGISVHAANEIKSLIKYDIGESSITGGEAE